MEYKIVEINNLIPLEKVFPIHLDNLEKMINNDGYILKAIIADEKTGMILDGSHRYAYFLKNGFKTVPVRWVNYSDENIRVGTRLTDRWLVDGSVGISKKECIDRALAGNLFPPRTTRHFFPFRKVDISLPLKYLEKGTANDIAHLVNAADVNKELLHNEGYINEIDDEIRIILDYLSEVSHTRSYLVKQISLMQDQKKVAFFPGKFHPPHIGHIMTLMEILPKYKKLIIGVTQDIPHGAITTVDAIADVLGKFFKSFNNVEIVKLNEILIEKANLDGLPEFDVLISGNPDVLDWAKHHHIDTKYISRSDGFLFSGTEIREIFTKNENDVE